MSGKGSDLGYVALPVIISFEGVDKQVNDGVGKALGRLGNLGKKSGADLSKGLGDGLKSAEADVKRATDAYEKLRNRAEDAIGKIRVEEEKLAKARSGGKTDQIVAAEERLAKARRDSAKISKDAESSARRLTELRRAADGAADAMTRLGDSGGNAGKSFMEGLRSGISTVRDTGQDAADGLSSGFGGAASLARLGAAGGPVGIALAGLAAVAFGVGKTLAPAIAEGMEMEALRDKLQAQMGADDETVRRLGDASGKAYAHGFGASVADNLTVIRDAQRAGLIDTTADDGAVAHVVEKLQGLSMVTEASTQELSRSIATLMRNGLAGSVSEAADIVTAGFQKGLDVSGDWLDTVNEYSTQARKFGLDAGEYMTLLSQGLKGGARDTDKVADSLKEFAIRAVDGSKTTREGFEALGLSADDMSARFAAGGDSAKVGLAAVFDAIKRVDDPMQQALIWQRLFGTQFEDMGTAVNQFDLTPAKNEFTDLQGVSDRATKAATDNFKAEWEQATNAVSGWFDNLKVELADWFTDLPFIRDIPDMIQSAFDPTYFDIKAPDWVQPGTPLTALNMLDQLAGAGTGTAPANSLDSLLLPLGGTPLAPPPAAPVPGAPTPILADAQAQATKDLAKTKPPALFPGGLAQVLNLAGTTGGSAPYGLPAGTDTGGYGSSGAVFPAWVHAVEQAFGVKASTYSGHQESDRNEPGFARNQTHENRGIDWSGSVDAMQRFADYLATVPGSLEQVIWQNPDTGAAVGIAGGKQVPNSYYAGDFGGHRDHVHTRQSGAIPLPGQAAVPLGFTGGPIDTRGLAVTSAGRSPGYDQDGKTGYWESDPKQVREADQRARDAQDRILDADAAVAQALARVNELDADASESQRLSAEDAVRKATSDAARARREADDARADLAEAKKGKFTAGEKSSKSGKGGGEFDDLGGIFSSFFKETFGFDGSVFPDLSEMPAMKSLGALMGFAKGSVDQGAQSGWQPGAGVAGLDSSITDSGAATSSLPFGLIPGVSSLLPTPPADPGVHNGGGAAPGPTTVDQSTHLTLNSPQLDDQAAANRTRQTLLRTPRLGTYSAPQSVGGG